MGISIEIEMLRMQRNGPKFKYGKFRYSNAILINVLIQL